MNILPKKRWHVRTKDNIARVRKDEAEAADKEKARQQAIKIAESEARIEHLRDKARQNTSNPDDFISLSSNISEATVPKEHINFFQDVEDGTAEYKKTNKEYEKEKKEDKEKYEKQIGYLTYLGQDTNEALGKRSWYEELPNYKKTKTVDIKDEGEVKLKQKSLEDPMVLMKKYTKLLESPEPKMKQRNLKPHSTCDDRISNIQIESKNKHDKSKREKLKKKRKSKKHRIKRDGSKANSDIESDVKLKSKKRKRKYSSSSDSSSSDTNMEQFAKKQKLEILRTERLNREKEERRRSNELFAKLSGGNKDNKSIEENDRDKKMTSGGLVKQKYNSQFNPTLAKQNFI